MLKKITWIVIDIDTMWPVKRKQRTFAQVRGCIVQKGTSAKGSMLDLDTMKYRMGDHLRVSRIPHTKLSNKTATSTHTPTVNPHS